MLFAVFNFWEKKSWKISLLALVINYYNKVTKHLVKQFILLVRFLYKLFSKSSLPFADYISQQRNYSRSTVRIILFFIKTNDHSLKIPGVRMWCFFLNLLERGSATMLLKISMFSYYCIFINNFFEHFPVGFLFYTPFYISPCVFLWVRILNLWIRCSLPWTLDKYYSFSKHSTTGHLLYLIFKKLLF